MAHITLHALSRPTMNILYWILEALWPLNLPVRICNRNLRIIRSGNFLRFASTCDNFWAQVFVSSTLKSPLLVPQIFRPSCGLEMGLLASMLACGGTQKSLRSLAFMAFRESKQSLQKNCITQWKKTCDHYSWNLGNQD